MPRTPWILISILLTIIAAIIIQALRIEALPGNEMIWIASSMAITFVAGMFLSLAIMADNSN